MPAEQFRQAAAERGLLIPDDMTIGKIQRCAILGRAKGNLDGAFLFYPDGLAAGGFQNHADGRDWENWHADLGRPLNQQEVSSFHERVEAAKVLRDAEEAQLRAAAADRAQKTWEKATPCEYHPYLATKGIRSHGLRVLGDKLVMPFYTPSGSLSTVQTITATGSKLWQKDGRKRGCFYLLGQVADGPVCVAEGYATAASIHEATGYPVACAGDAGNLVHVAKALRLTYPRTEIVICADDDLSGVGKAKAQDAAKAVNGRVALPDWGDSRPDGATDFNDLARARGLEAVKSCIVQTAPKVTPNRLDSLRWSAIRNLAIPETVWHWDPYFPEIPFGLLVSLPGHGKSILMIQLAVAIATGLPLFGFATGTPGSVVIVALEDSKKTLHKRLAAAVGSYGAAFAEEHHRLLDANLRIQYRSENPLAYESPEAHDMALTGLREEIIAEAQTCEAPLKITFIDTFNNVHGGDENSASETRPILAAIYALHTRLGCSVWALHHVKKVGTARNAPPLVERLDPDLSRGSGAILGGLRAQVQFGWIYPKEALKVGLEPVGAARRYAIMALTKINDGAPSSWLLLEHTANAGLWAPVPNGAEILARLRGSDAIEKATTADLVLMAIYEANVAHKPLDRAEVAQKLFADHKKPSGSLSTYLSRLVTDRLVTADKRGLTEAGVRRVKELLEADGGSDAA